MNGEERNRFDSINALRQASYASFNDRRGYEWKLALAIWSALAILLARLVQPTKDGTTFPLNGDSVWIAASIVGVLLIVLHAYWSNGAARANRADRTIEHHYMKAMQSVLALPFDKDVQAVIDALPRSPKGGWRHWSHLAQVGITALLVLVSIVVLHARSS